jgi:hypothetical protein
LIKFLEGGIAPGSKAYWRLEHQFREVQKQLVEVNDKKSNAAIQQFLSLLQQREHQGPAIGIHTHFVNIEMRELRRRWEKEKDIEAVGEAFRALEAERGTLIEDPRDIAEEWVRRAILEVALRHLPRTGSGRLGMSLEEKEKIIADCKKWRPVCEGLNKAFKRLWEQSEYESSERHRKEARGFLAEKYTISVKEVKTIERVLKAPSRRGNKSTPTEAMLQIVALDHVDKGVKTIEQIWGDYLDKHPEERAKRRSSTKRHPTPDH